jgi:hypothetical protein
MRVESEHVGEIFVAQHKRRYGHIQAKKIEDRREYTRTVKQK